jgi:hypothetical protein
MRARQSSWWFKREKREKNATKERAERQTKDGRHGREMRKKFKKTLSWGRRSLWLVVGGSRDNHQRFFFGAILTAPLGWPRLDVMVGGVDGVDAETAVHCR